jgi:hypothetical protein
MKGHQVQIVDNNCNNHLSKFNQMILLRSTVNNFQSIYFALNKAQVRRRAPIGRDVISTSKIPTLSNERLHVRNIAQEQTHFFT